MANNTYLHFFHLGGEHFNYVNGTYLQDISNSKGLTTSYNNLNTLDLTQKGIQGRFEKLCPSLDILITEDDKGDMIPVIEAAIEALGDKGNIGICADIETLKKLVAIIPSAPGVMSLDLQLTKHVTPEDALKLTAETYENIRETATWNDTVVIAISNHARHQIAEEMTRALHYRGDSLYRKDLRHLPKVLPDIFVDALTKHTHRSRFNATEEALNEISRGPTSPQKPKKIVDGFISDSLATRNLKNSLLKFAETKVGILLLGETGTGKEVAAQFIHQNSPQRKEKFFPINMAAISETMVESALFGHKKGAFTGADKDKMGAFEIANDGTIFLDEIGDLKLEMQAKLLRILSTGDYLPVGAEKEQYFEGRVIAATCKDIDSMIEKGEFREDLYYRLAVFTQELPPLRERVADIPALIDHFLTVMGNKHKKQISLKPEINSYLMSYDYPGNIRDLEHIIQRLVVICEPDEIASLQRLEESLPKRKRRFLNQTKNPDTSYEPHQSEQVNDFLFQQLDIIEHCMKKRDKKEVIGKKLWPNKPKESARAQVSQLLKSGKAKNAIRNTPNRGERFPKILSWYDHYGHTL